MKKFIVLFLLIVVGGGGFYLINQLIQQNLSVDDSSALFGGDLEKGYPSAGYLISYEPGGAMKTCGYAVLNNRVVVTASHCVDNSESIFLGLGDFSVREENHIEVTRATQKEQWINNKERAHDFAILNFNDNSNFYEEFAVITSPTEGCKYRVVAYGRTEDPTENFIKPRKSAALCARDITSNTFIIEGDGTSGICFGDSGSPVYYEGTNNLVGQVVSIILEDPNNTEPCAFGNTAIVVRADANQNLINENIQTLDASLGGVSVVDGLTIDVADQTIFDQLGLSQLNNLSREEQLRYILFGVVGLMAVVVIALVATLTRKPKKKQWE